MMSSGRGPGVIGMLLALLVLFGFGVLFVFVFDEGLQGGERTIESVLKSQEKDIARYEARLANDQGQLALIPGRLEKEAELKAATRAVSATTGDIAALQEVVNGLQAEIAKTGEDLEAYKEEYRAFARREAAGRKMETLETKDGKVFKNVEFREVDAIGILLRHEDGQQRVAFENLPDEMQDHFQFDASKKDEAIANEDAVHAEMEAAAAAADVAATAQQKEQRAKEMERIKQENIRLLALKEQQLSAARSALNGLERDKISAEQQAAAARAAGKQFINRSGAIRGQISSKQREITTLTAEIARLRSAIR